MSHASPHLGLTIPDAQGDGDGIWHLWWISNFEDILDFDFQGRIHYDTGTKAVTVDADTVLAGGSAGTNLATSGTEYLSGIGQSAPDATEDDVLVIVPVAGEVGSLRVFLTIAPGSGKSRTFTLRKNGADTALVVAIADANTAGADVSNSVTVAAGDRLTLKATSSGTPAASKAAFGMVLTH